MGGDWSSPERERSPDPWWGNAEPGSSSYEPSRAGESTGKTEESTRRKVNQDEMDAFKREIARKRELRRAAIASVQNEMKKLKNDLESERILRRAAEEERNQLAKSKCNQMLSDEIERLKTVLEEERSKRKEIEDENSKLKEKEGELEAVEHQIKALKEVASIGREMLRIRELQVNELKKKLEEIELSMPSAPEELRLEYETQIQNIRKLRTLYEERIMATRTEHQQERERDTAKINMLEVKINALQEEIQEHKEENARLEAKLTKTEETVEEKVTEIETLQDQLYSTSIECRSLKSQMKIINDLFSQVLAGPEFDLDRLTRLLKENHGLITDLTATGDSNDVAALLLDIAEKAEEGAQDIPDSNVPQDQTDGSLQNEKEEIASNLSKVWKVLVELLSHHKDVNQINAGSESCYKNVDTPSGPRLVISVSQTYLTLKDLILEKNSLVKEVGRLKTLNKHLETRMHSQERRLSTVSTELKKTWNVVSKLRAQHKQLHNHEKILRYELQHKRQMLTELKQELEHCREKWDRARQKNTQSEEDWKQLRKEFALRKVRKLSNSAESGYEEEDSHSSPSEEISEPPDSVDHPINVIPIKQDISESSDGDLSEEDVDNSDGNSYETVIDLLDIACLESQIENENLTNTEELISFIESQETIPLTDNEFTEGLNHIESFELVSDLDICQPNVPTPDFSSPFPSSRSSPIPTETEDLTSSEVDISEDIPRSNSPYHQLHFTEEPIIVPDIPQDNLLFGSNSAQNISIFLEGLLVTNVEQTNSLEVGVNAQQYLNNIFCEQPSQTNQSSATDSQKETSTTVQGEKESLYLIKETEILDLPLLENDLITEENTTNIKTTFDIPKILIVSENDSTVQPEQETPEIEENLNENSVFDSECVADAIQLCLQDIKNSIPSPTYNEEERTEVNNNIPEVSLHAINDSILEAVQPEPSESLVDAIKDTTDDVAVVEEDTKSQHPNENKTDENEETSVIENKIEISSVGILIQVEPSTSRIATPTENSNNDEIKRTRTPKEILEARAERLKRLEEQCKSLFSKMSATSRRSDLISNKLEELHEHYGPSQYPKHSNSDMPSTSSSASPVVHSSDNLLQESFKTSDSKAPLEKSHYNSEMRVMSNPSTSQMTTSVGTLHSDPCCSKRLDPVEHPTSLNSAAENSDLLDKRAVRLKRLEDQCQSLYDQVTRTNHKSNVICDKLQELHDHYGSREASSSDESSNSEENQTQKNKSEETQPE